MVAALKMGKDANSYTVYAANSSTLKYMVRLDNSVAVEVCTLPVDADWYTVNFRYEPGHTVWIDVDGGTAEFPSNDTPAETDSQMNPATLLLAGGTVINAITPNDTTQVGIVIWQGGQT